MFAFCPETIFQVIVGYRSGGGYSIITAIVIDKNESFIAYYFTCTKPAENNDGIFQRGLVYMIQLVFGKLQTTLHHIVVNLLTQQKRKPHAFVGITAAQRNNQCNRYAYFLHNKI